MACILGLAGCVWQLYRSMAKRHEQTMDEIKQAYFGVQRQQTETLARISDVLQEIKESLQSMNGKRR